MSVMIHQAPCEDYVELRLAHANRDTHMFSTLFCTYHESIQLLQTTSLTFSLLFLRDN